jgi:hypothetical protein
MDVRDEEWAFVAPNLALLLEDTSKWTYAPREVFNGLRSLVKSG